MVLRFLSEAKKKIDANTEPRCMYAMYMYDQRTLANANIQDTQKKCRSE